MQGGSMNDHIRIIIIEDDSADMRIITHHLNQAFPHITIRAIEQVTQCADALQGFEPDIILSDFKLGAQTAYDVQKIATEFCPDVPIIVLTGALTEQDAIALLEHGIWDYVLKDKLYKLVPAIKHALTIKEQLSQCFLASRKMQEVEHTFRTIVEKSPFPTWIADPSGTVTIVNQSLLQTLKVKEHQVIGAYNVLRDENLRNQGLMSKIRMVFTHRATIRFTMYWQASVVEHTDFSEGNNLFIDVSMYPVLDAQGNLLHVVCQWLDITNRKKNEEQLQQKIREMEIFHNAAVDRELLINELRQEVNDLLSKAGKPAKYEIVE